MHASTIYRDQELIMSDKTAPPEFDDLADAFWRLGIMQSPSELHGRLIGQLAVGETLSEEQWLKQARVFLDPVGDFSVQDGRMLLALLASAHEQVSAGEFDLELLLPGDAFGLTQRVDALGHWCQGFLAGFAQAGKVVQERKGQQQYSAQLSETLSDMAAISQVGLADEQEDEDKSEKDFFELNEYLRMAALSIYYECTNSTHDMGELAAGSTPEEEPALNSPAGLFNKKPYTRMRKR